MKCKECGCYLSPKEIQEILETLSDGFKAERLCDECWNMEENMRNEFYNSDYEEHSDADMGL